MNFTAGGGGGGGDREREREEKKKTGKKKTRQACGYKVDPLTLTAKLPSVVVFSAAKQRLSLQTGARVRSSKSYNLNSCNWKEWRLNHKMAFARVTVLHETLSECDL